MLREAAFSMNRPWSDSYVGDLIPPLSVFGLQNAHGQDRASSCSEVGFHPNCPATDRFILSPGNSTNVQSEKDSPRSIHYCSAGVPGHGCRDTGRGCG